MRRAVGYPFLLLGVFLFCWIHLPKNIADGARSLAISVFGSKSSMAAPHEMARLQLENQSLRSQMEPVYDWLLFDQRLADQFDFLKGVEQRAFAERRVAQLRELLKVQLSSLPAQVIYRDPSSWSSSLWINVGEEHNVSLGRSVVAKNSPVLSDGALVGVVDYVGKKQARVRLITDSGLAPAVRVYRGSLQNRELARQIQGLSHQLEKREDLFATDLEKKQFLAQLESLKGKSGIFNEDGYLAKGEVRGSSAPFWRSRSPLLKGVGFNYDYPDEEGIHRDPKIPILKEGDLLVTSGLDGVFPSGIPLGNVTRVEPLREGAYAYEIVVRPLVTHLNDLETLFILPPVSE